MKTSTAIVIATLIVIGAGYFVIQGTGGDTGSGNSVQGVAQNNNEVKNVLVEGVDNSVIKDGVQYITITAHGGYSPRSSFAKAGIPTSLVVKTNGTYDCSASLAIHSLKYQKMLPNTGETVIDAGIPKAGDILQGVCGMGMYSFAITFK
jgi:plastocyanin domain-containing protein